MTQLNAWLCLTLFAVMPGYFAKTSKQI